MLKVSNLSKTFAVDNQQIAALKEVDFEVKDSEFLTLIGPSGCGKSTLLRILAGLEKPTSGKIDWDQPPKLSFVFQSFALFPYLTVSENIGFGLQMSGVKKTELDRQVKELIKEVELDGFEEKHPKELSGGMRQRVGIARALAIEPNVLLLDEPFSALDEFTAETLRALLLDIWQKRQMTVIMVTHLIREALELADKIAVLTPQPGTVREVMDNKLDRPRNMRTKEFFKMEDRLRGLIKLQ